MPLLLTFILFLFTGCLLETEPDMRQPRDVYLDIDERPSRRAPTPVESLEPRTGTWTNSNEWGNGYSGPMPLSEGKSLPVFHLGRTFGPPAVHTVNLFASQNVGGTNSDIRVKVDYGTGAVNNTFMADWFNGQQFSLVADHLTITAVTFAPIRGQTYVATGSDIQLSACVAKGDTGGGPLTYTEGRYTMAIAETNDYAAPAMAKAVIVHMFNNNNPSTATNVALRFLSLAGGLLAEYDAQVMAGGNTATFLPAGMDTLRVINNSGGAVSVDVQWILGL